MPECSAFKQVDEKHVAVEVELMVWSPKFDLVALSNVQGEVCPYGAFIYSFLNFDCSSALNSKYFSLFFALSDG